MEEAAGSAITKSNDPHLAGGEKQHMLSGQPSTSGISQRGFEARQPDDRRCHSSPIRPSQPDRNAGRCANLLGRNYLPWRWGWGFQGFSWQWWSQRHEMLGYDRKQWTSALDGHSNGRFDVSTSNCQDTKSRSKSRSDGLDFQMPTLDQPYLQKALFRSTMKTTRPNHHGFIPNFLHFLMV